MTFGWNMLAVVVPKIKTKNLSRKINTNLKKRKNMKEKQRNHLSIVLQKNQNEGGSMFNR